MWHRGMIEYFACSREPSEELSVRGTMLCLSISLIGVLLFEAIPQHTARFITAFSTMLIFTKSERFNQMLHTLISAVGTARHLVEALFAVSCLYALAAQDLFSDKVLDEVDKPLFSTYGRALSTTFRMFVDGSMVTQRALSGSDMPVLVV